MPGLLHTRIHSYPDPLVLSRSYSVQLTVSLVHTRTVLEESVGQDMHIRSGISASDNLTRGRVVWRAEPLIVYGGSRPGNVGPSYFYPSQGGSNMGGERFPA